MKIVVVPWIIIENVIDGLKWAPEIRPNTWTRPKITLPRVSAAALASRWSLKENRTATRVRKKVATPSERKGENVEILRRTAAFSYASREQSQRLAPASIHPTNEAPQYSKSACAAPGEPYPLTNIAVAMAGLSIVPPDRMLETTTDIHVTFFFERGEEGGVVLNGNVVLRFSRTTSSLSWLLILRFSRNKHFHTRTQLGR